MSVWEHTTYKLQIAKTIYENIPFAIDSILGHYVGQYLQPKGELHTISSDDSWDMVAEELDWVEGPEDEDVYDEYMKFTEGVKFWHVGLSAVYKLIAACYLNRFDVRDQYNYPRLEQILKVVGITLAGPSMITPTAFVRKWNQVDAEVKQLSRKFDNFSEAWKYYARCYNSGSEEWVPIDQQKFFGSGSRSYHGKSIGKLIVLVGSGKYRSRGLILTKEHLNILIESAARISNLVDHIAREHVSDTITKDRMLRMLDLTINRAAIARGNNVDKVVQAFHKARAYMQMVMFRNEMNNALSEALAEYNEKGLPEILSLEKYIDIYTMVPKGRWLEILHVYKWMPPPDYDSTYAFQELYEHHTSTRKSGLDKDASPQMVELWKLVVVERKMNIATAYKKVHNEWPTDLVTKNDVPTKEGLESWVPKALFPYYTYGKDISSQIKDKTTVLPDMSEEIKLEKRSRNKNFLLWFLSNNGLVDTRVSADALSRGWLLEDNYARVAYKGEAHKPGSRLFFMAPPVQRILLGELEGNISRIASCYPASLQGMDSIPKASRLMELFDVSDRSFVEEVAGPYTCYVITFDLSKFSPKFNPAVLQDLHAFWAEVFDYNPIRAMGKIGAESVILHTTDRLVMQYKNQGADLEGFRGRMMTLFHADLIGAACRYAKSQGIIVGKSVAAVFIDDGAVRIAAQGVGEVAKSNALKFLRCMQDVYAAAGQENHPNKTIVSSLGGELLAEQYLYGQRIKCPVKAAMRMFPGYSLPANCITEEFDAMFSTIQGSIKDGADWVIAYRRYCEAFLKAIARWDRKCLYEVQDIRFSLKLIVPKSMGGFGFPSLPSLVTTTAYNMTSEGLGMLSYIARGIPAYQPYVDEILMRSVIKRSPLQILRDPTRIRMGKFILVEGRLLHALIKSMKLTYGPWQKYMSIYNDESIINHATKIAEAFMEQSSVSIPVLKRAWEATPMAYSESLIQKFNRAGSILAIIPSHEIRKLRKLNRNDVSNVLKQSFVQ